MTVRITSADDGYAQFLSVFYPFFLNIQMKMTKQKNYLAHLACFSLFYISHCVNLAFLTFFLCGLHYISRFFQPTVEKSTLIKSNLGLKNRFLPNFVSGIPSIGSISTQARVRKNYVGNRCYSTKGRSSPLVASYSNPIDLKTVIYKENLKKVGIYRWTNLINGKIYIGSSSNLGKRFSGYLSSIFLTRESLKTKSLIYSALSKYGYSNFKLDILEYCDPKELLVREQYYLDLYLPDYNILKTAGSSLGFKHSEETLLKFKLRELSKEHAEFLRKAGTANLVEHNKNRRLEVAVHDYNTDKTNTYASIDEASKAIKVDTKTFWDKEKSEKNNNNIIPYQGRYVITILRDGITNVDHNKRVELARENISKGLINRNKAKGNIVVVTNVVTGDSVNYTSVSEAGRSLNVNRFTVSRYLKDQKVLNGLYKFSYLY